MSLKLQFIPYTLDFRFDAGTSRGVMKKRDVWFIKLYDEQKPAIKGLGECAPLKGLSLEDISQIEFELERLQQKLEGLSLHEAVEDPLSWVKSVTDPAFPSIRFAMETAILDLLNGGKRIIFENDFSNSFSGIPINGLVWMGDKAFMQEQIAEKLRLGYQCVKMKVGAIDFEDELALLKGIRKSGGADLDLRIDANGAFSNNKAFKFLQELEELKLHSIEQPIMPRQPEAMSLLCEKSLVPIALDEDLIGINSYSEKRNLLTYIKPQYIVIKPSLVGGISSTIEWISLADELDIGWWITSALESNIGLNAIAQLTANYKVKMYQGLGTGQLYHNNINSPLQIKEGFINYRKGTKWDLSGLNFID